MTWADFTTKQYFVHRVTKRAKNRVYWARPLMTVLASDLFCSGPVISSYGTTGRETYATAADPYLGQSLGPIAGYGVSN